jgi:biopolymer transport protein TolR
MSMRRKRQLKADMNVVPYIDVMLVLLIIFMVAAPLINPGTVDLPSVGAKLNPAVAPLEVRVAKDGSLKVVDRNKGGAETKVTKATLVDAVKAAIADNKDQPVVIAGDKDVRYEEVLVAMDALQTAGISKVGLLAKPAAR